MIKKMRWVEREFEFNLPVSVLLRGATLGELADRLCHQLGITGPAQATVEVTTLDTANNEAA